MRKRFGVNGKSQNISEILRFENFISKRFLIDSTTPCKYSQKTVKLNKHTHFQT